MAGSDAIGVAFVSLAQRRRQLIGIAGVAVAVAVPVAVASIVIVVASLLGFLPIAALFGPTFLGPTFLGAALLDLTLGARALVGLAFLRPGRLTVAALFGLTLFAPLLGPALLGGAVRALPWVGHAVLFLVFLRTRLTLGALVGFGLAGPLVGLTGFLHLVALGLFLLATALLVLALLVLALLVLALAGAIFLLGAGVVGISGLPLLAALGLGATFALGLAVRAVRRAGGGRLSQLQPMWSVLLSHRKGRRQQRQTCGERSRVVDQSAHQFRCSDEREYSLSI